MDTETIGTIEFIALTLSWNKKNSKLVIQVQKGYVYGYVCFAHDIITTKVVSSFGEVCSYNLSLTCGRLVVFSVYSGFQ
jgi:hypothetical protein